MQRALYYLSLPFVYALVFMPFWLAYPVARGLGFLAYYVFGYRKAVVFGNLRRSFPEKTEKELQAIGKKFYKFLFDTFVEIIKAYSLSNESLLRRVDVTEQTRRIFEEYYQKGKSTIVYMGHLGNWEWPGHAVKLTSQAQTRFLYKPASNPYFGRLIYKLRSKFGVVQIAMNDTIRYFLNKDAAITNTFFIADQSAMPDTAVWTTFLNQDTAFFSGAEKLALRFGLPVLFCYCTMPRRGRYVLHTEVLCNDPSKLEKGEITRLFARRLEQHIREQPEIWLWSHKRWKYKRPSGV